MLFIFCQWYSKASTRRSFCERSPTSAQDVHLCAWVRARCWVLEMWQRALAERLLLGGGFRGEVFPQTGSSLVVQLHDRAVEVRKHS